MFEMFKQFTQFGSKKVEPEEMLKKEESFAPPNIDDALVIAGGLMSSVLNFGSLNAEDKNRIDTWRALAKCPEIAWAVQEVCNDAIVSDYKEYPCQLDIEADSKLSKQIREKLSDEFKEVLRLLNFKREGVNIFRQWYIDGKQHFHAVLDDKNLKKGIIAIRWLDPRNIKKVVEMEEYKNSSGHVLTRVKDVYYIYNQNASFNGNGYGSSSYRTSFSTADMTYKVHPEIIASSNSGLFSESGSGESFAISHLELTRKAYNMLSSLETAMTIYRIARAPERRVFYVDVGSLPNTKAEQHLAKVMTKFKRKLSFDPTSGEIRAENNEMSILDDYWLPRKDGGRGTEVTTLQQGQAWQDLNDLEWFQKKVLRALNVPFGRYQSENAFSSGRSMEITREEVRFAKFVAYLRSNFSQGLIELLKIQVIAKGIMTQLEFEEFKNEIYVKWKTDAYWDELLFNEMWSSRVNLLSHVEKYISAGYFSIDWAKRNVLQMTEEEINAITEQNKANPPPPVESGY